MIAYTYDVFMTKQPTIFEAMALFHSRVRRLVFGVRNEEDGGLGGSRIDRAVHFLPWTNHHYREFGCSPEKHLRQKCAELHPS